MVYAANLFSVQFSQGGSVRSYGFIGIAPRARTRTPPAAPRADRAPGVMALSKLSGDAQLGQHPGPRPAVQQARTAPRSVLQHRAVPRRSFLLVCSALTRLIEPCLGQRCARSRERSACYAASGPRPSITRRRIRYACIVTRRVAVGRAFSIYHHLSRQHSARGAHKCRNNLRCATSGGSS